MISSRLGVLSLLAAATLAATACKPRNPDEGGLLSADEEQPTPVQATVAAGGEFHLTCQPADPDSDKSTYDLEVTGAVNEHDESQDVLVSVLKTKAGAKDVLADKVAGRGAVSVHGPVFVGFPLGVLTADPQADGKAGPHAGVLTLANDRNAD